MTASLRMVLLASVALLPCGAARAADVTAEQGRAAEAAVQAWISGMLGPAVTLSASPITLTPAGDHFNLTRPIGIFPGQSAVSGSITAEVRPLDDGKWAIDNIHSAMPITFTALAPVPGDEKKADEKKPVGKELTESKPDTRTPAERKAEERAAQGKMPAEREADQAKTPAELKAEERANQGKPPAAAATPAAAANVPVTYTINIGGQDGHAVLDPTLATASTLAITDKNMTIHIKGGPLQTDSTIGTSNSTMTVQPSGPDRVDLTANVVVQDYHIASAAGLPTTSAVDMKAIKVAMAVLGLDRVKAQAVSQATTSLFVAGGAKGTPKMGPELVTAMLVALKDAASEASLGEEADGISINASGAPLTIGKVEFALNGKSVNGMLEAHMPIEVRDIGVQGVLPPDMAALLPTLVTLRPALSGVGVAELSRLAAAYNEKSEPSPADLQALFSHGGVKLGLESMSVAFGGALFEGQGAMTYTSVTDSNGTMHITATGYDDMMQKVAAIPAFSGQAVPALAFVKGIGKTDGNKIVWDVVYKDGKALVNNVDMSSMFGGAAKDPAPTPNRPPAGLVIPK